MDGDAVLRADISPFEAAEGSSALPSPHRQASQGSSLVDEETAERQQPSAEAVQDTDVGQSRGPFSQQPVTQSPTTTSFPADEVSAADKQRDSLAAPSSSGPVPELVGSSGQVSGQQQGSLAQLPDNEPLAASRHEANSGADHIAAERLFPSTQPPEARLSQQDFEDEQDFKGQDAAQDADAADISNAVGEAASLPSEQAAGSSGRQQQEADVQVEESYFSQVLPEASDMTQTSNGRPRRPAKFINKRVGPTTQLRDYCHMATQTDRPPPRPKAHPHFVAATQTGGDWARSTQQQRIRRQQTAGQDCSMQTTSWDFWEDSGRDRWVMTSGSYNPARAKLLTPAVITLQRHMRGHLARRRVRRMRFAAHAARAAQSEAEARAARDAEVAEGKAAHRRLHPSSAADFRLLRNDITAWFQQECSRIHGLNLAEADKLAALTQLHNKELVLLGEVESLSTAARPDAKHRIAQATLESFAAPLHMYLPGSRRNVSVYDPSMDRAGQLLEIWKGLTASGTSDTERGTALLRAKVAVQGSGTSLAAELVQLINREASLVLRGMARERMGGLQKRISTLFLQLMEDHKFNPASKKLQPGQGYTNKQHFELTHL